MPHLLTAKYRVPVRTPTHDRTAIPRFIGFRPIFLSNRWCENACLGRQAPSSKIKFGKLCSAARMPEFGDLAHEFLGAVVSEPKGLPSTKRDADPTGPLFRSSTSSAVVRWRSSLGLVARLCPDNRSREVIPRHCIESGRNQFIRFRRVTLVFGFDPLGFLNILRRKLAQALGFSIAGNRIIGGQQIPGAIASALASHAYHERLLNSSVSLLEGT